MLFARLGRWAALLAAAALVATLLHHRRRPAGPPPRAGDAVIARDLDRQESLRLRGLHRAVSAEIAAAAARGVDSRLIELLQALADTALKLDLPGRRAEAMERLNRLRLTIPQERAGRPQ